MGRKLLYTFLFAFICGCIQLQVPIASTVTNVTVIKSQNSDKEATMQGSRLDDIAEGITNTAGDVDIPLVP